MANEYAPWSAKYPVVYSAASDETVASAWQKYIAECARLYELLQRVRVADAGNGTEVSDAVPYQMKIDTLAGTLSMRLGDNSGWVTLGKLSEHFGITPEEISALRTGGGLLSLTAGKEEARPLAKDSQEGAWYLATDNPALYRMGAKEWELMLALDVQRLQNFDKLITSDMVSLSSAAGKIPRADDTGKISFDTTGSAAKIAGFPVDTKDIKDGTTLVYRDTAGGFVLERKGGGGTGGESEIDDSQSTTGTTYSAKKLDELLAAKVDKVGDIGTGFVINAYDETWGEPSKITVGGTKVYTMTRDEYGRLATISCGDKTAKALYNVYGQFAGMEGAS